MTVEELVLMKEVGGKPMAVVGIRRWDRTPMEELAEKREGTVGLKIAGLYSAAARQIHSMGWKPYYGAGGVGWIRLV